VTDYSHLAGRDSTVEVGHSRAHLAMCPLGSKRAASNPRAQLIALQPSLEISDQGLSEIFGRIVELAHMIARTKPIKIGVAAIRDVHLYLQSMPIILDLSH
jgi:hypothetical protein